MLRIEISREQFRLRGNSPVAGAALGMRGMRVGTVAEGYMQHRATDIVLSAVVTGRKGVF